MTIHGFTAPIPTQSLAHRILRTLALGDGTRREQKLADLAKDLHQRSKEILALVRSTNSTTPRAAKVLPSHRTVGEFVGDPLYPAFLAYLHTPTTRQVQAGICRQIAAMLEGAGAVIAEITLGELLDRLEPTQEKMGTDILGQGDHENFARRFGKYIWEDPRKPIFAKTPAQHLKECPKHPSVRQGEGFEKACMHRVFKTVVRGDNASQGTQLRRRIENLILAAAPKSKDGTLSLKDPDSLRLWILNALGTKEDVFQTWLTEAQTHGEGLDKKLLDQFKNLKLDDKNNFFTMVILSKIEKIFQGAKNKLGSQCTRKSFLDNVYQWTRLPHEEILAWALHLRLMGRSFMLPN